RAPFLEGGSSLRGPPTPIANRWASKTRPTLQSKRAKGIEPSPPAWKAGALPLSYARGMVEGRELMVEGRKDVFVFTLNHRPSTLNPPVVGTGFEPVKA